MAAQGRLGDKANAPLCAHGCPACPHPTVGPAISGSPNVNVNGKPAVRVDDSGVHSACCGPNQWRALAGSPTVFINGKPAHRAGDATQHCGGNGTLVEGSPNVDVGGASSTASVAKADRAGWTAQPDGGGAANTNAPADAYAAKREALREAASGGKGLVHHDCKACHEPASVQAPYDAKAREANRDDDAWRDAMARSR
ncbi:MAG TPA: PAAR domain-containing protein [Kofleriaceae bacterium]|jgi:uncharacterized Zn-binding protein involved in type VI secretion